MLTLLLYEGFPGFFFYVYSIEMTDVYVDLGFAVVFSA